MTSRSASPALMPAQPHDVATHDNISLNCAAIVPEETLLQVIYEVNSIVGCPSAILTLFLVYTV